MIVDWFFMFFCFNIQARWIRGDNLGGIVGLAYTQEEN